MSLILVDEYIDDRDRRVLRFHAPSSTIPGKVYTVDNLAGTDIWSCGPLSGEKVDCCEASTYKKPCRHIPNWREPPKSFASSLDEAASPYPPGHPSYDASNREDFSVAEAVAAIAEKLGTLQEMIERLAQEDPTFRRLCAQRKSGPFVIYFLHHYFGLRMDVPKGESLESYLMSLPQFSTIRTAVYEVRRAHEQDLDWDVDVLLGLELQAGYAWSSPRVAGQCRIDGGAEI